MRPSPRVKRSCSLLLSKVTVQPLRLIENGAVVDGLYTLVDNQAHGPAPRDPRLLSGGGGRQLHQGRRFSEDAEGHCEQAGADARGASWRPTAAADDAAGGGNPGRRRLLREGRACAERARGHRRELLRRAPAAARASPGGPRLLCREPPPGARAPRLPRALSGDPYGPRRER